MWELDYKEGWVPVDGFELWCWRTLLRVPWTARRSNQSDLKEINPEYSLERMMLKLKPWYYGHLMQRANSLEMALGWERLRAGGEGWDGWMASPTQWTWVWATLGDGEGQENLAYCSPWGHRVRHDLEMEKQQPISINFSIFCGVIFCYIFYIDNCIICKKRKILSPSLFQSGCFLFLFLHLLQ